MDRTVPSLLLLIPAYNEEERIGPVLREYARHLRETYEGTFEIVVVLNGCRDNTLGVVREVATDNPEIRYLDFPAPIGKGGALIEGLKLAPTADLVGYVDADGATGPDAFLQLVHLVAQADCVIGSRWLPGSILHQSQPRLRRFASRVFPDARTHMSPAALHRVVRSLRVELADRAAGIDGRSDRLAFVIAAAADRRMCGVDPGAAAGCVAVARPRAGPSRMIRRTDMKTSPNQALEPTETSSCRGSIMQGASRVSSCLRGSVQRSAHGFIRHHSAI
jgi:hypothetical protein